MRTLFAVLSLLVLSGCAGTPSPFVEARFAYQHMPGSDWVFQPERDWTPEERAPFYAYGLVGLEWERGLDCPYLDVMVVGPWEQTFLKCGWRGYVKDKWMFNIELAHQDDSRTEEFLRTDQSQWQGDNPFVHFRVGYEWGHGFRFPVIATGNSYRSILSGKAFGGPGEPDLYWTHIEAHFRLWGKTGQQFK